MAVLGCLPNCYDPDCEGCNPKWWTIEKLENRILLSEIELKAWKKILKKKLRRP